MSTTAGVLEESRHAGAEKEREDRECFPLEQEPDRAVGNEVGVPATYIVAADYESRLKLHILPKLGHLRLDEVRVVHIAEMVQSLKEKKLAPRTIRHIYFQTHGMFQKAVGRELLAVNPCVLDEDDLPAKIDHDPEWR